MDDEATAAQPTPATVVFLHGSGDNARQWDAVIAGMDGYACLALDLPGHGAQRDRPGPERMSVSDYANVVRAELTRRALSGVTLVGHSLGSAIALQLALDHPSLVRRVAVVGGGARLRVLPAVLDAARAQPLGALESLIVHGFAPGHGQEAATYAQALAPTAPGMLARDLSACDGFDLMPDLGRLAQPTLVLVGEHDRLTPPKYARYLHEHLAHATLVILPDAGHYLPAEAPDAVSAALRSWLSQTA